MNNPSPRGQSQAPRVWRERGGKGGGLNHGINKISHTTMMGLACVCGLHLKPPAPKLSFPGALSPSGVVTPAFVALHSQTTVTRKPLGLVRRAAQAAAHSDVTSGVPGRLREPGWQACGIGS